MSYKFKAQDRIYSNAYCAIYGDDDGRLIIIHEETGSGVLLDMHEDVGMTLEKLLPGRDVSDKFDGEVPWL